MDRPPREREFHALHERAHRRYRACVRSNVYAVSRKAQAGLLGMAVGGHWMPAKLRDVKAQGFVAIGIPLVILVLGGIYFALGR